MGLDLGHPARVQPPQAEGRQRLGVGVSDLWIDQPDAMQTIDIKALSHGVGGQRLDAAKNVILKGYGVLDLRLDPEVFERRSTQGTLLQDQSVEERAKFHYYLAKTYAHAGTKDRALLYIRKALEEGFKDRDKFVKEPEFAALQDDPEFKELLATEQRVL